MKDSLPLDRDGQGRIGKQIILPWRKAVEIAAKSIKVRFWRSMITMISIILAIAFLMAIWTSTAILAALAVKPQRELDALKARLGIVRGALEGAEGALSAEEIKKQFADEIAAARSPIEEDITKKEEARKKAKDEEKEKLDKEIAELAAQIAPEKEIELLRDHLGSQRRELQRRKGAIDDTLQGERGERAEESQAPPSESGGQTEEAGGPARAGAGGFVTDFLRQMSPTDKWLAILALLVCFVGIANAMFMTVQERFREIGTMKCLGALDSFIVKIFLIESASLGFIGTLFGIIIGLLLSTLRQLYVYGWPALGYFPGLNVLLAALLAALVGLILSIAAALLPAQRAARMEPVEAMRVEE